MKELKIRGLQNDVHNQLKEIAKRSYFPSLNQFLVVTLTRISKENGLLPLEEKIKKRHLILAEVIQKNNEVMLKAIKILEGKE